MRNSFPLANYRNIIYLSKILSTNGRGEVPNDERWFVFQFGTSTNTLIISTYPGSPSSYMQTNLFFVYILLSSLSNNEKPYYTGTVLKTSLNKDGGSRHNVDTVAQVYCVIKELVSLHICTLIRQELWYFITSFLHLLLRLLHFLFCQDG